MNDGARGLDPSAAADGSQDIELTLVQRLAEAIESIRSRRAMIPDVPPQPIDRADSDQ
ncbi:hypothetical protein ACFXAW_26450 [Streptomyces sp. NPDC059445]|uniref:hypothetical protein n=1 Tax=Streptomyces sp. NPDC059445 TaxID=3346832 RepID=UPI0036BF84BE